MMSGIRRLLMLVNLDKAEVELIISYIKMRAGMEKNGKKIFLNYVVPFDPGLSPLVVLTST